SSQPCVRPGSASRSKPSALASHPLPAGSLPTASWYSRASHRAIRAAAAVSPRSRSDAYARSRWSIAPSTSPSHHSVRPIPSSASGVGSAATASEKASLALSQSPSMRARSPRSTSSARATSLIRASCDARRAEGRGPWSGPHRVPDGLELDERRDLVGALRVVVEGIDVGRTVHALHVLGGELFDLPLKI